MPKLTEITALLDKVQQWIEKKLKGTPQVKVPVNVVRKTPLEPYSDLPLEIGNELLITDEIVKMYDGLSNAVGRVVIIDQISLTEKEIIKASAFGIQVNVNLSVAQQMRAEFLQRDRLWSSS